MRCGDQCQMGSRRHNRRAQPRAARSATVAAHVLSLTVAAIMPHRACGGGDAGRARTGARPYSRHLGMPIERTRRMDAMAASHRAAGRGMARAARSTTGRGAISMDASLRRRSDAEHAGPARALPSLASPVADHLGAFEALVHRMSMTAARERAQLALDRCRIRRATTSGGSAGRMRSSSARGTGVPVLFLSTIVLARRWPRSGRRLRALHCCCWWSTSRFGTRPIGM